MKIGIDASNLATDNKTGVELVTERLIRHILLADDDNQYILYAHTSELPEFFTSQQNAEIRVRPYHKFWTSFGLSQELKNDPPDVFWEPGNKLPISTPNNTKVVTTIHDLGALILPEAYPLVDQWSSYLSVLLAKWKADRVVCVSNTTKDDLQNHMGFSETQLKVVPNSLIKSESAEELPPNIPDRYFLFVGRLELRKNLIRLIEAYKQFKKTDDDQTFLVLAGSHGFGYDLILDAMKRENLTPYIITTGYIDADVLSTLQKNALAITFPSLYEGFGLPILEGFNAETPVLTSETGAMAEVGENAALTIDPEDVSQITEGLKVLAQNQEIREKLVSRGRKRLNDFSWQKSALQYIDIFENL